MPKPQSLSCFTTLYEGSMLGERYQAFKIQWAPFNLRNSPLLVSGIGLLLSTLSTTSSTLFLILTPPKSDSLV